MSKEIEERCNELEEHARAVGDITRDLQHELRRKLTAIVSLPDTQPGLIALVDELADADADKDEHFTRFAAEAGVPHLECSAECQADWTRACRRHDAAVAALVAVGRARKGQVAA